MHPSLSDAELAALRPGDAVYAKRFHRQGAVVRVNPLKKIAIINLGLFEVEAPFDGLAKPEAVVVKPGRQRQRRRSTRGGGGNDASSTPHRGETTDS